MNSTSETAIGALIILTFIILTGLAFLTLVGISHVLAAAWRKLEIVRDNMIYNMAYVTETIRAEADDVRKKYGERFTTLKFKSFKAFYLLDPDEWECRFKIVVYKGKYAYRFSNTETLRYWWWIIKKEVEEEKRSNAKQDAENLEALRQGVKATIKAQKRQELHRTEKEKVCRN